MILTYPHTLWFLLIIAALGLLTWPRGRAHSRRQTAFSFALRLLALTLLVFALAQPIITHQQTGGITLHLVDAASATPQTLASAIHNQWQTHTDDDSQQRLVLFNADVTELDWPQNVSPASLAETISAVLTTSDNQHSRLDTALTLAQLNAPISSYRRIVVYTDGWLSGPNPFPLIAELAQGGVTFDVVPIAPESSASCVLLDAQMPSQAQSGQTVTLRVRIGSTQAGPAMLNINAGGRTAPVVTQEIETVIGDAYYDVSLPVGSPGVRNFTITCTAAWDTISTDNELSTACVVSPAQEVLVVEPPGEEMISAALRNLLGNHANVRHVDVTDLAAQLATQSPAVIVWGNPAPATIPSDTLEQLRNAVLNGTGLWTVGGRNAYNLADQAYTPMAELLPIDVHQTLARQDPSVALVIIIDTSGSMRGARFDLAKETARLAIQRLLPHDKVGIVEFYGTKRWAARLQSASNGIDVYRALNRLNAGGGTVILPALEEAHAAMLNVRAQLKHVLILTDGGVETGPFQRVITRMADDGITVSTVLVGPGQHSAFLSDLAQWGRGRAYQAPDQFRVPEIILRRPTEQRRSNAIEQTAAVTINHTDSLVANLEEDQLAPLTGYNRLDARATADTILHTDDGSPLLVRWRYGRGFVVSWLSDLGGPWATALWDTSAGRTLAANVARQLSAANPQNQLRITLIPRLGGLEVDVRLDEEDSAASIAPLNLQLSGEDRPTIQQTVDPLTPGRWNTWIPDVSPGTIEATAHMPSHNLTGRAATSIRPDLARRGVNINETMLREISDVVAAHRPVTPPIRTVTEYRDIWPWLVLAALACFLLNVLVRRWPPRIQTGPATLLLGLVILGTAQPARADQTSADTLAQARAAELKGDLSRAERLLNTIEDDQTQQQQEERLLWRALLLHDAGQRENALALLTSNLPDEPAVLRSRVCMLTLLDEPQAALQILNSMQPETRDLIAGSMLAQRTGQFEQSDEMLTIASEQATTRRDRQFIAALRVALAEQTGNTAELAQSWLDNPQLPSEATRPLFQMLWDLGRRTEALNLADRQGWLDGAVGQSSVVAREITTLVLESNDVAETSRALAALVKRAPENINWYLLLARLDLAQHADEAAINTLLEAVQHAADTAGLFHIASVADKTNARQVVDAAIARILTLDPQQRFQVALWQARRHAGRGDTESLTVAIADATAQLQDDRGRTIALADTLQRLERFNDAIVLLEELQRQSPDDSVAERCAWLLERVGRLDDALATWRRLWNETTSPSQQRRAAEHVLDLAARTAKLADLAIEIEQRLAAGTAQPHELDLLLEIYIRVGDSISAGEILMLITDQVEDDVPALRRLSEAYLRMGQVGLCDQVLDELQTRDPDRQVDYLQQRVLLAIERKRPREAKQHAHELAQILADSPLASELTASMYTLLDDHAAAAQAYADTLAAHPERIELWLLWGNAMRSANQTDLALQRMRELVDEAKQDDLLLVAIDGLLNLDAPPTYLQYALRRLQLRMAAAPQHVYLFDAATDVLEALGRRSDVNRYMELAVAFSAEQRGDLIREMMDCAKALQDLSETIELGTLLILLDHHVPADAFIELGQQLLHNERYADAARAFSRASALGDHAVVRRSIGRIYFDNLFPEQALRVFEQLLTSTPDDVELRILAGAAAEQMGIFDDAFAHYLHAYQQCVRRVADDDAAPLAAAGRRRRRVAVNVSMREQFLRPALDGLLSVARTPETRDELLAHLAGNVTAAIKVDSTSDAAMPASLVEALGALRRVAFSLGHPDVAYQADRHALSQYSSDSDQRLAIAQTYQDWGLVDLADSVADESVRQRPQLRATAIARILKQTADTGDLDCSAIRPTEIEGLLPALCMLGQTDAAHQLLQHCESIADNLDPPAIQTILTTCVMLEDPAGIDIWLPRFIEHCGRIADAEQRLDDLRGGLRVAWWSASPAARTQAVRQIESLARNAAQHDYQLMRFATQLGADAIDDARQREEREQLAIDGADDHALLTELLNEAAPNVRIDLLNRFWSAQPPDKQATFLAQVATDFVGTPDDDFLAAYSRLLAASAAPRVSRHFPYRELRRPNWTRNTSSPELGLLYANAVREWFDDSLPALVTATQAEATASETDLATAHAAQAFDLYLAGGELSLQSQQLLRDLLQAAPQSVIEAQRAHLAAIAPDKRGRLQQYVLGAIEMQRGHEDAAINAFTDAFQRQPADRLVRRELIRYLTETCRFGQLVALLSDYATDPTVMDSWERTRLAEAYVQCGAAEKAAAVLRQDDSTLAAMWLMEMGSYAGDTQRTLKRLRQHLINNRLEQRFFAPNAQYEELLGGLEGYLEQRARRRDIPRLYTVLATNTPAATPEFFALYRTATPGEVHLARLAEACWHGTFAAHSDAALTSIRTELPDTSTLPALTFIASNEQLADQMPWSSLSPAVQRALLADWQRNANTLSALAHADAGEVSTASAGHVLCWLLLADLATPRPRVNTQTRFEWLDAWLDAQPEATRQHAAETMYTRMRPLPGESAATRLDALLLEQTCQSQPLLAPMPPSVRAQSVYLARAHARTAVLQDRWEDFEQDVTILSKQTRRDYRADFIALDPLEILPPANELSDAPRALDVIAKLTTADREQGQLPRASAVRILCLLAWWCADNDLTAPAQELTNAAVTLADDQVNSPWLWILDVQQRIAPQAAEQTLYRLAAAGLLTARRIEDVLDRWDEAAGDKLLYTGWQFLHRHDWLARVQRHAAAIGDDATAASIQERLLQNEGPR